MTTRSWVWAAGSLLFWVAAWIGVAVVIVLPIQYFGLLPHPVSVALWAAAWVVLSGLGVLLTGRLVYGRFFRVPLAACLLLGVGAALNAVLMLTLIEWATREYGYWDPDHVGDTALLWYVVAGASTAGFAMLVAPPDQSGPAVVAASAAALLTVLIVTPNAPGLLDGVPPDSWAFAASMAGTVIYALVLASASLWRLKPELSR